MVNSAREWHDHFDSLKLEEKLTGMKLAPPELKPWGFLITHVQDPAGLLLHFAQKPNENIWSF